MENSASNRIEAELARRFEDSMETGSIATALVALWLEIDVVLCPIIGQRGVVALYQRSLHITARVHPWLTDFRDDSQSGPDYTQLKTLLAQQQCADLVVAGGLLFKTFYELLVSLVGPSLTERLLRSVGANLFSGPTAQDCP